MYYCEHCHSEFDEPHEIITDLGTEYVCPDCHSTDFDEAEECEECGKVLPTDDLYGWDHHICMDCLMNHKYDLPTLIDATDEQYELKIPMIASYIMSDDEIVDLITRELERRVSRATDKFFPSSVDFCPEDYIHDFKRELADYIGEEAS